MEYPIGKPFYETGGWIGHPRVSPKGDLIAFIDHPVQGDDSGSLAVVDLAGHMKRLSGEWFTIQGLAWSPDGKEIWFTASKSGVDRTLYATTLDGKERMVLRLPGAVMIFDIFKDGRVLLMRASWRRELIGMTADDTKQHDLSWLDYTYPADLSGDGKTLLFDEEGGGGSLDYSKSGGLSYAVYIRKTDGSPAVLLGEGGAVSLSPDGKSVIAQTQDSPSQLKLLTTGAGEAEGPDQRQYQSCLGPLVSRREARSVLGQRTRQGRDGSTSATPPTGKNQPITPEGVNGTAFVISPDSQTVAGIGPTRRDISTRWPAVSRASFPDSTLESSPSPLAPTAGPLYIYQPGELPARVDRLDLHTGQRTLWRQLMPSDPAGVETIGPILMTPDAKTCVFGYHRMLADLYLVEGLK